MNPKLYLEFSVHRPWQEFTLQKNLVTGKPRHVTMEGKKIINVVLWSVFAHCRLTEPHDLRRP